MTRGSILFLRAVLLLVGVGVLAGLLWEPQVEGRNVHADQFTIYFRDPFLAYVYLGSLPFFFGLYQAFKFLGYVGQGRAFSPAAVTCRTGQYRSNARASRSGSSPTTSCGQRPCCRHHK